MMQGLNVTLNQREKTYSDAVNVKNIGGSSVCSESHKQLSLITINNLIIHIYVDERSDSISGMKPKLLQPIY